MFTPQVMLGMSLTDWLDAGVTALTRLVPEQTFFYYPQNVIALFALLLVGLVCGAVGSLVVGGRMAFFSDPVGAVIGVWQAGEHPGAERAVVRQARLPQL